MIINDLFNNKKFVAKDNLNELDIFAPVTTYVRLADGTYVAVNWRRNQDLSTASNSASFIDIKPLAPAAAKQLGLDQRLNDPEKKYTGATTIASGGPIQASGPLADRTINVVDIRDPKAAKDSGVPDTLFGKIAQWTQQQGQKQPGVAEDDDAVAAFLARGGQVQTLKPAKPRKGERWQGSSHIGAAGGRGTKGRVSGLAANTGKSGKPVVTAEQGVDESWKSALGGAALAGSMALGSGAAQAQNAPSGEDFLPAIVAHVTFKVNGNTITKDINLGTRFKSPGQASAALEKFLKSKGIKFYEFNLERVSDTDYNNNYLDKTPLSDKGNPAAYHTADKGYTPSNNTAGDYMVKEVSLGDYRKKATVNKAVAQTNRFFDRNDTAKVAAADQTIAKREKGLARADARTKAYMPPAAAPMDLEKQQRDLTARYPNIDELVRRAELNRDPNYERADGQAYYAARDAEQNYLKLKQIQRVIQGLNESLNRSHLP